MGGLKVLGCAPAKDIPDDSPVWAEADLKFLFMDRHVVSEDHELNCPFRRKHSHIWLPSRALTGRLVYISRNAQEKVQR